MIAQQFDLFGAPDTATTTAPLRTAHQQSLFVANLFAHVDPNRKPAPAPDLDPDLHDATIDDITPESTPEVAEPAPATERPAVAGDTVSVGDRFSDPNLLGAPCLVTEVDPAGAWFEARWIPGAPAYLYPTSHAARWTKVAPAADTRPELIDLTDLTDADLAALAAGAAEVDDDYLAARRADLAADDAADDICPITGMSAAERAAQPDAAPEPAPARRADPNRLIASTRRVSASSGDREYRYVGLVRRGPGGPVLAECGHEHPNRDQSTGVGGRSAVECARDVLAGAALPATAEHVALKHRDRWQALTRGTGHAYSATTIAKARASASADADAYLDAVAAVRAATVRR